MEAELRAIRQVVEGQAKYCVLLGDALRLLELVPDGSIGGVVSDPPYSSGGAFRGDRTLATGRKYVGTDVKLKRADFHGDTRDQRSFAYWCVLWLAECLRASAPSAPIALCIDWRQLPSLTDSLQAGGWILRGIAGWDKTEAVRPQLGRFRQQLEFVVWGSNGPMPLRPEVGALPGVFRHVRAAESRLHQTGKPEGLMMDICRIVPPGSVILDPFCGSGSTGVAALRLGYRFVGFELSEEWAQLARDRLAAEAAGSTRASMQAGQVSLLEGLERG